MNASIEALREEGNDAIRETEAGRDTVVYGAEKIELVSTILLRCVLARSFAVPRASTPVD